ncbi:MAG: twin-arginine translocation signal domain-containing protein, partial [Cyanobacteria bacterium P01_F01_bin.4]
MHQSIKRLLNRRRFLSLSGLAACSLALSIGCSPTAEAPSAAEDTTAA